MTVAHPPRGPFIGVRAFEARDELLFSGRADEICELSTLWRRNRLTILHSDAGAGKTSLLRAGLIPGLERERARVLPVGQATSSRVWPAATLPDRNPYVLALLSSWGAGEPPARIAGWSVGEFLRRHDGIDRYGDPAPTLAAIDQAETFLRQSPSYEHHRAHFLDELFETLERHPRLHLLLSVRTDYLDDLLHVLKGYGSPGYAEFGLRAFSPEQAAAVVNRSMEVAGHRAAPQRVAELVEELRNIRDDTGHVRERSPERDIDPLLLQVAGSHLWGDPPDRERFMNARLDVEVDRALNGFCARALAEVAADYELSPYRLETWLRQKILHDSRRFAPLVEVRGVLLHALEDHRLLKALQQHGLRLHQLRRRRLAAPLRRLDATQWPAPSADPAARLSAAVRACWEGQPERARRIAEEAAFAAPGTALRVRADLQSLLGNIAYEQDELDEAVARYREAAKLYEALPDGTAVGWTLTAIGRIALAQDKQSDAIEELHAALGRSPHDLVVRTTLGQVLWEAGEPQAAITVLTDVIDREGDASEARRTRGEILADLGQATSALQDIGQSASRWPQPSTRAARALALATLDRVEAAGEELSSAIAEAEDNGPALLRAARVHELTGDVTTAAEFADQAISARHPRLPRHQRKTAEHLRDGA
ncbi:Tetratricopeptide repeat-containing protein [Nonomuraea solani]|uniref:Tetratricopeptide repeat-containing protein n=1 Tax=Nonomuraea solani TaxID=1144553 RepID=A0A1H6ETP4_9ACTN|nr:tetratricopeptide repeat protein [Nonomuraea solani]SEH01228.1 Tetratricopeptide repeat-containing protein [Nonomuraea solani]